MPCRGDLGHGTKDHFRATGVGRSTCRPGRAEGCGGRRIASGREEGGPCSTAALGRGRFASTAEGGCGQLAQPRAAVPHEMDLATRRIAGGHLSPQSGARSRKWSRKWSRKSLVGLRKPINRQGTSCWRVYGCFRDRSPTMGSVCLTHPTTTVHAKMLARVPLLACPAVRATLLGKPAVAPT